MESCKACAGCMAGYPDGTYQPERNLTRAEFAAQENAVCPDMAAGGKTRYIGMEISEESDGLKRLGVLPGLSCF